MSPENKAITYSAAKYIIGIILAITPVIVTGVNIENRLSSVEQDNREFTQYIKESKATHDLLVEKISNSDLKYAEIKASLEGIKVMQQDILTRLQH